MTIPLDGFVLEQKPVFDWNRVPLGHVSTAQRDPKTRAAKRITLELSPEAQTTLGTNVTRLEVPASYIFGMRRDGLTLDRSVTELRHIEFNHSVIKP